MARQHPRTIAYRRVSTHEQDVAKNQTDILLFAHRQQLGQVQCVEDTVSGRVPWRRHKIAQVLDTLEAGATLVVSELSRLGRRMLECMEILALATQKGLHLHAVKGDWQLDGSMQSTIIAMAFAMAAEIERGLISQRTREALRVKKAAGMPLGRPRGPGKSQLDPYQPEIEALLDAVRRAMPTEVLPTWQDALFAPRQGQASALEWLQQAPRRTFKGLKEQLDTIHFLKALHVDASP